MEKEFKLCYIEDTNKAWFTDCFEHQWGDDWNDKPYECNAGTPYDHWSELIEDNPHIWKRVWKHNPINHKVLYFETEDWSQRTPSDDGEYSVEEINKGRIAWLSTDNYNIFAGTTYNDFIQIIEENGGTVYVPRKENV